MSEKKQHSNIIMAAVGFAVVVVAVGIIGLLTLGGEEETLQGEVEVSEYRVSSKLPGRIVELRVQEGDYVKVGDTLAILEVPEAEAQKRVLEATGDAAEAMSQMTDEGARQEQIRSAYALLQQAQAAEEIARKTYNRMQNLFDEGVVTYRTNRHGNIVLLIDTAGKMAFDVEKEVPVENNTDNLSDLMLRSN